MTIPIPAYLLDTEQLDMIKRDALSIMEEFNECSRALACIAAINKELKARNYLRLVKTEAGT